MEAPKNLDELWQQQAEAHALLMKDPRRLLQTRELANVAGKLIDIVKAKLVACELCGVEADIPQLGKYRGDTRAVRPRQIKDAQLPAGTDSAAPASPGTRKAPASR